MITLTFFSRSLKGRCYGNRHLAPIGENWHTSPSFCALAFHSGRDRNRDARVHTADDPCTSGRNLLNVGPVTPEFCRRVCKRWALPRISIVDVRALCLCGVYSTGRGVRWTSCWRSSDSSRLRWPLLQRLYAALRSVVADDRVTPRYVVLSHSAKCTQQSKSTSRFDSACTACVHIFTVSKIT